MQRYVLLLIDGKHEIVEYDTATSSSAIEREKSGGSILADYPTVAEVEAEQTRILARVEPRTGGTA